MENLKKIDLFNFDLEIGKQKAYLPLFYNVFGRPLGSAPVVVVNHSLTGNSKVTGEKGWWSGIVGENRAIDTDYFTVIAFNIPGNGFDDNIDNLIDNYPDFTVRDIARIF